MPVLCKFDGLLLAAFSGGTTDADLRTACTAGYNSCLAADGGTTTCNPSATPSTCTSTVGDLTTCFNAETAATAQFPDCSTLTAATLATVFGDGGTASIDAGGLRAVRPGRQLLRRHHHAQHGNDRTLRLAVSPPLRPLNGNPDEGKGRSPSRNAARDRSR